MQLDLILMVMAAAMLSEVSRGGRYLVNAVGKDVPIHPPMLWDGDCWHHAINCCYELKLAFTKAAGRADAVQSCERRRTDAAGFDIESNGSRKAE